ncbi:MAG: indole-3-glycerol phosphate synthase TrpC [bacterium]
MNILEEILEHKRGEIKKAKRTIPQRSLQEKEAFGFRRLSLLRALRSSKPAIIAEVKRASPSKGIIRKDFDALTVARDYVQNGATALSVLTDEKFFRGDLRYIEAMRKFVTIPILRKDFIIDPYQLYESKAAGVDAVLLIVSALDSSRLNDLLDEATGLGLQCMIEVHSKEEIETLRLDKIDMIGINNRNLETFETDIATSAELRKFIPDEIEVVSESGINTSDDVRFLLSKGITSFLIGESFMKAEIPGNALRELLSNFREEPA